MDGASNEKEKSSDQRLSTIRTLQGDVATLVAGEQLSLVAIALKEAQKRREKKDDREDENQTSKKLIAGGVLFALLGVGVLAYVTLPHNSPRAELTKPKPLAPLLFVETMVPVDIETRSAVEILNLLTERLHVKERTVGSIEQVTPQMNGLPITSSELLLRISSGATDRLTRSLDDRFVYGVHALGINNGFFLFTTDNYETVFADLLLWEQKSLAHDLIPLLHEQRPEIERPTVFTDHTYKNIDVRELADKQGGVILVYGFLDSRTLFIAANEQTMGELVSRVQRVQPVIR